MKQAQIEIEATPAEIERFQELLKRRDELKARPERSRWYCDRQDCDGEPHGRWHWCDHPLDSDEHTWECRHARANQHPPPEFVGGQARIWLVMAGRGFGKSRAGAEWLIEQARNQPGTEWGVVARTTSDLRGTCFEGKSGLLRALGWQRNDPRYNKTELLLRLDNGSIVHSYSAEEPSSVHGPNLTGVWLDEIAKWKSREMWDSLSFAIRDGDSQTVATTTPARTDLVREFVGRTDGSVVVTCGSTFENERNLSGAFIAEQRVRWQGTRRERQELYGELLEDVPGALWTAEAIERTRAVLID